MFEKRAITNWQNESRQMFKQIEDRRTPQVEVSLGARAQKLRKCGSKNVRSGSEALKSVI